MKASTLFIGLFVAPAMVFVSIWLMVNIGGAGVCLVPIILYVALCVLQSLPDLRRH